MELLYRLGKMSVVTFQIHKHWVSNQNRKWFAELVSPGNGNCFKQEKISKGSPDRWRWYV